MLCTHIHILYSPGCSLLFRSSLRKYKIANDQHYILLNNNVPSSLADLFLLDVVPSCLVIITRGLRHWRSAFALFFITPQCDCFDEDLQSCRLRIGRRLLLLLADVWLCWGEVSGSDSVQCVKCVTSEGRIQWEPDRASISVRTISVLGYF